MMQFINTERIVNGYNIYINRNTPLSILLEWLDFAYSLTQLYKDNFKFAPIINFITESSSHKELVNSYQPKIVHSKQLNLPLSECAVEFFGITNDAKKAGYMTLDGQMLDFSGSNMKISLFDTNYEDVCNLSHDTFFGINDKDYQLLSDYPGLMTKPCPVAWFIKNTGFIRMTATHKDRFISYIDLPNKLQLNKIYDIYRDGSLIIEHIDENGNTIDDVEFSRLTKNNLNWVYSH